MPQESWAFVAFCKSLEAVNSREYGDDVDLNALGLLAGEERRRAEEMLRTRLTPDSRDPRVARALVHLLSDRAIELLRKALLEASGTARVSYAQTLAGLDPGFDPVSDYLASLAGSDASGREAGAHALAGRTEPHVLDALLEAVKDEGFGTRLAPFNALIESLGLQPLQEPRYNRLREIGSLLVSDLPSVTRDAVSEIVRIVTALRAGESPPALGLDESLVPWEADIDRLVSALWGEPGRDFEDLETLQGAGRRFFESMLLYEIRRDDPRVPRALARIGTVRAIAALEDARRIPLKNSVDEIASALETLRRRLG